MEIGRHPFHSISLHMMVQLKVTSVLFSKLKLYNFIAGLDYNRIARVFEIDVDEQNKTLKIPLINDNSSEVAETFFAEFSFDDNRILLFFDSNVPITILDDEG